MKVHIKTNNAVVIPCKFGGHNIFENIAKETVYIDNLPILSNIFDSNQKLSYPQVPSICYVGGLTYSRGITHLIKASYGAGVKLILCGNFNPIEYHSQLMELPEYECVDYRGFLNRDQVVDVQRIADRYVYNPMSVSTTKEIILLRRFTNTCLWDCLSL